MNRLDEIREREAKASCGPWLKVTQEVAESGASLYGAIAITPGGWHGIHYSRDADGEFVAKSRDDIPYLLQRLDAAEKALRLVIGVVPEGYESEASCLARAYFAEQEKSA